MSWSMSITDTPTNVIAAINNESTVALISNPQAKAEFDLVKDHLIAVVKQNWSVGNDIRVAFSANGHGSQQTLPIGTPDNADLHILGGIQTLSSVCNVTIVNMGVPQVRHTMPANHPGEGHR